MQSNHYAIIFSIVMILFFLHDFFADNELTACRLQPPLSIDLTSPQPYDDPYTDDAGHIMVPSTNPYLYCPLLLTSERGGGGGGGGIVRTHLASPNMHQQPYQQPIKQLKTIHIWCALGRSDHACDYEGVWEYHCSARCHRSPPPSPPFPWKSFQRNLDQGIW